MASPISISVVRGFVSATPHHTACLPPTPCGSCRFLRFVAPPVLVGAPSSRIGCTHREKKHTEGSLEEFSVLSQAIPLDSADIWTTMALYFFSLHVPLSFGGLSIISGILHRPELDPLTEAISVLLLQTTEFAGALAFLHYIGKQRRLSSILSDEDLPKNRSWMTASLVGLAVLFFFALFTSIVADQLIGPKDVNDLTLHEILHSSPAAKTVCFFIYCFVTPVLEEMVYRGFLLASLSSTMKWQQAVALSALTFSFAHLSLENAPQLFVIGAVLGCVYSWTGNLSSSIFVHSVYNFTILVITSLN